MDRLTRALAEPDGSAPGGDRLPERELLVMEVRCRRDAPGCVRTALSHIKELGAAREDALLVASELVTNAVVHSGGTPADMIRVRALLIGDDVSISVHDPGLSDHTPHLRDAGVAQAGGQGLRIVKQLARRWGFERASGYRVWAEIATDARHRPGSRLEATRAD